MPRRGSSQFCCEWLRGSGRTTPTPCRTLDAILELGLAETRLGNVEQEFELHDQQFQPILKIWVGFEILARLHQPVWEVSVGEHFSQFGPTHGTLWGNRSYSMPLGPTA